MANIYYWQRISENDGTDGIRQRWQVSFSSRNDEASVLMESSCNTEVRMSSETTTATTVNRCYNQGVAIKCRESLLTSVGFWLLKFTLTSIPTRRATVNRLYRLFFAKLHLLKSHKARYYIDVVAAVPFLYLQHFTHTHKLSVFQDTSLSPVVQYFDIWIFAFSLRF